MSDPTDFSRLVFGRLSWEAIPLHEPILIATFAVVALGGLALLGALTYFRVWGTLWRNWFTSIDHKKIGIMYIVLGLVMLLRGFGDAIMMRLQQAIAFGDNLGYLPPHHYDQIFTAHGVIMIFFVAMPLVTGIMNYVVPLLIVEDDEAFARTLVRSFSRRGYQVLHAASLQEVESVLGQHTPGYAVVDLKLRGEASGLACVQRLHAASEAMLIVVLTGFASIATAVEAVKLGACHYLAKPSNTDDIEAAFGLTEGKTDVDLTNRSSSIKTLEWERIHEVLAETGFNISETARRLGMHRRTLARKLGKQRVS